jgi:hypothetical protein
MSIVKVRPADKASNGARDAGFGRDFLAVQAFTFTTEFLR